MAPRKPLSGTSAETRGGTETSPRLSALKASARASRSGSTPSSRSTSIASTQSTSTSGTGGERHALDRDLRPSAIDQVGDNAARTAGHGEAHVPVAAVEVQIVVAG